MFRRYILYSNLLCFCLPIFSMQLSEQKEDLEQVHQEQRISQINLSGINVSCLTNAATNILCAIRPDLTLMALDRAKVNIQNYLAKNGGTVVGCVLRHFDSLGIWAEDEPQELNASFNPETVLQDGTCMIIHRPNDEPNIYHLVVNNPDKQLIEQLNDIQFKFILDFLESDDPNIPQNQMEVFRSLPEDVQVILMENVTVKAKQSFENLALNAQSAQYATLQNAINALNAAHAQQNQHSSAAASSLEPSSLNAEQKNIETAIQQCKQVEHDRFLEETNGQDSLLMIYRDLHDAELLIEKMNFTSTQEAQTNLRIIFEKLSGAFK